ncbi:MAG: GAF domain-containing protein [Rubellimicrobium sp.]|nr:GAF domain-containing protein [Rubellimicrobium sp.]
MTPLETALARAEGQPEAALDALGALAAQVTGARLVTLMTADPETGEAERIWSNHPTEYPVSGRKPFQPNRWTQTVLDRHETFVANDFAGIAEVFGDHDLIRSLGCESVMNLPAIVDGRVLGTVNCLDAAGHFTPERLAQAEALRLPATAVFLHHLLHRKGATR